MGTNIALTTENFSPGDKSWIRHRDGMDTMRTITLDLSLFDPLHVVNGRIPSGTVLGLVTATGFYGPYEGGQGSVNEVQLLTPGGTISGGTWQITFDGATTAAIQWNANAAAIQAALEALPDVNVGSIVVTGGPISSGVVTLTFSGSQYADIDVPQVLVVTGSLTGAAPTLTPSTSVVGGGAAPVSDGRQIARGHLFEDQKVTALATDPKVGGALFWEGIVLMSKLPNFTGSADGKGELDATAIARLSAFIRYE